MANAGGESTSRQARRLARRLRRPAGLPPERVLGGYAVAVAGTVGLTAILLPFRSDITPLSKGFGFLIVVVLAAAIGGLGPGLVASVCGFLTFNYFFLPPYDRWSVGRPEYVVVLFVFLGLSILISTLLSRALERASVAEAREAELRTLQSLSAELVALRPGPDGYAGLLRRLLEVFEVSAGAVFVVDAKTRELEEAASVGAEPGELTPRSDSVMAENPPDRLPLSVGGRNLGLIVLRPRTPPFTPPESRVLRAFCDQFALVLERDRLLRQATQTQVLNQAEQVRRSLLAAVSHDLRTPLAAIKASVTDLLAEDADHGRDYLRESLRSINIETDRLAMLVANLLDMSRIEQGMLRARVQGVDLSEAVSACQDRLQTLWPAVRFNVRIDPTWSVVQADPVFLERVVGNLLENAVRVTQKSPDRTIDVEARGADGRVTVRVIDHGPGIPESVREQLFYPFYQVSQRHPRLGTGLGLPIARGFLSLMDGQIWIEDTPGGGATFAFSLPAQQREGATSPASGTRVRG
ncbi:MAG TPA: ATP-binding protein [Actinomycetota bacterium]